jgi:hypothetical protein
MEKAKPLNLFVKSSLVPYFGPSRGLVSSNVFYYLESPHISDEIMKLGTNDENKR